MLHLVKQVPVLQQPINPQQTGQSPPRGAVTIRTRRIKKNAKILNDIETIVPKKKSATTSSYMPLSFYADYD